MAKTCPDCGGSGLRVNLCGHVPCSCVIREQPMECEACAGYGAIYPGPRTDTQAPEDAITR